MGKFKAKKPLRRYCNAKVYTMACVFALSYASMLSDALKPYQGARNGLLGAELDEALFLNVFFADISVITSFFEAPEAHAMQACSGVPYLGYPTLRIDTGLRCMSH
jgi:hypothetical protein